MNNLKIEADASPCVGDVRPRSSQLGPTLVAGLLAAVLVMAPSLTFADENSASEVSKESGLGAAAAVSSLIYGPAKILYATGGVIVGAFAYAFTAGDTEVAKKVFTRSLRGDYVITPAMLTGEERLVFIGRDSTEETIASPAAVASAGPSYTPAPEYEDSEYDDLGW